MSTLRETIAHYGWRRQPIGRYSNALRQDVQVGGSPNIAPYDVTMLAVVDDGRWPMRAPTAIAEPVLVLFCEAPSFAIRGTCQLTSLHELFTLDAGEEFQRVVYEASARLRAR